MDFNSLALICGVLSIFIIGLFVVMVKWGPKSIIEAASKGYTEYKKIAEDLKKGKEIEVEALEAKTEEETKKIDKGYRNEDSL